MVAFCIAGHAKIYTLPNGKVLEDPYVIGQRPDGLDVGHKYGAMFVKFTDLPVEIQKKYNYDPEKAAEYEKEQKALKEKIDADNKKKQAEMAAMQEQVQKNLQNWKTDQLGQEIQKTKIRIEFLKTEIPKLEQEYNNYLNKTTELAGKNVSGNTTGGYAWDGGYVMTSSYSGDRSEDTKRKAISMIGDEFSDVKKKLNSYKKELETKESSILTMQKQYDAALKSQKADSK